MSDLSVFRGDDKTWNLTFTDSAGDAYDITGATIFFTVKENENDTDGNALISKDITSHTNAAGGLSAVTVTDTDTDQTPGVYVYDIQLLESDGTITTIVKGDFLVKRDITQRIS